MKKQAIIVGDSLSPQGHRLTSVLATFPKYLLAEAKTHRILSQDTNEVIIEAIDVSLNAATDLSRNSASSRAIPFNRMIQSVKDNPFIPMAWMKEHKGMQGTEYYTDIVDIGNRRTQHLMARDYAIDAAETMAELGVTKQICNRYIEYFMYTTVLISGTEWENFFALRCPQYTTVDGEIFRSRKDLLIRFPNGTWRTEIDWLLDNKGQAEIHMMALAEAIWDAMNESIPRQLKAGEWHIPFEDKINLDKVEEFPVIIGLLANKHLGATGVKVKIATAMGARTSYTIVGEEKEIGYDKLIDIHDRMAIAVPFHASPFEHCAPAMTNDEYEVFSRQSPQGTEYGWCRNYRGFISYRHILENKT